MSNDKYFVIDLFAGCGGMSEGFVQAGFDVIAQIEMDHWACETLRTRHLFYELKQKMKLNYYYKYIRGEISREQILSMYPEISALISEKVIQAEFGTVGIDEIIKKIDSSMKLNGARKINIVIGGPPCQAYSLAGRARDPERMTKDKRHFLYEHYLHILEAIKPDFFVFENVPGLITAEARGQEIFSRMIDDFRSISPAYEVAPSFDEYYKSPRQYLLDSSNYGIPQKRKRVVFIGYKNTIVSKYSDVKKVFQKVLRSGNFKYRGYTVSDAIGDLPPLRPGQGEDSWFGNYDKESITPYQRFMRRNSCGVINHSAREHMESDLERYKFFIMHHLNGNKAATLTDLIEQRPDLTPAHIHLDKFLDRFKVQWWYQPASTIMAHICKDGHYYIHPDIHQCRSFTAREAARCQSFPDNFVFEGPRTEQFRQVGNAVPPLLARVIAFLLRKELKNIYE